jgi:hypothetical protein
MDFVLVDVGGTIVLLLAYLAVVIWSDSARSL